MTPIAVAEGSPADLSPAVLASFAEVTPSLLEARALLQRVDRKYLLPAAALEPLLAQLSPDYRLLKAAGHATATYETRYFDTPDRAMYHDHRRGRLPRYKVRIRHHHERQVSFLEVKHKARANRTAKNRLACGFGTSLLGADERHFLDAHCPIDAIRLVPRVEMTFTRLTLVGQDVDERLTLDWSLRYRDGRRTGSLQAVVIAEVKQGRYSNDSPSIRALRAPGAREQAISKYCLATARLWDLRANTFKPALRALEHIAS